MATTDLKDLKSGRISHKAGENRERRQQIIWGFFIQLMSLRVSNFRRHWGFINYKYLLCASFSPHVITHNWRQTKEASWLPFVGGWR